VKPFRFRNRPKFRPTNLRISIRASCFLHTMRFISYSVYSQVHRAFGCPSGMAAFAKLGCELCRMG
jgi:hypothetical protein